MVPVDHALRPTPRGVEVTASEIGFDCDERRCLTASAERDDRTWTVPLLDIEITADQHRVARLVAAYRRWLGIDR
ncbi:MAG TPA: hypothetical protein PKA87_01835 [Microthrixaceae bacterium]|nr:hypothetical protein [Microthrixaceae bacterium]HMV73025.1 hypothetical protein [Microthrixaceae bacterium]HMX06254.1 hypothetical protein [Microthrixaceae bacterium]HMX64557.1 hypothetical protein [Microthrixaceae bacterium]HMY87171.1 hypothetical protein [Microthrixaceae bacterium]